MSDSDSKRRPLSEFDLRVLYVVLWLGAYMAAFADQMAIVAWNAGLDPSVLLLGYDRQSHFPPAVIAAVWLVAALLCLGAQTVTDILLTANGHRVVRAVRSGSAYATAAGVLLLTVAIFGLDASLRVTPPAHYDGMMVNPFAAALACIVAGQACAYMRNARNGTDSLPSRMPAASRLRESAGLILASVFGNVAVVPGIITFLALMSVFTPGPCVHGRWSDQRNGARTDWTEVDFHPNGDGEVTEDHAGLMVAWPMQWHEDKNGIVIDDGGSGRTARRLSGTLSYEGDQLRIQGPGEGMPLLLSRADRYDE